MQAINCFFSCKWPWNWLLKYHNFNFYYPTRFYHLSSVGLLRIFFFMHSLFAHYCSPAFFLIYQPSSGSNVFLAAVLTTLQPVLLIRATGLVRFTAGVGNMNLIKGMASFIGTPIAGEGLGFGGSSQTCGRFVLIFPLKENTRSRTGVFLVVFRSRTFCWLNCSKLDLKVTAVLWEKSRDFKSVAAQRPTLK